LAVLAMSPDELEENAERVRAHIGATLDRLRFNLRPRNLIGEVTDRSGVSRVTPGTVFEFATKQHPVATILVGPGVGVWAFPAIRSSGRLGLGALRESIDILSNSARRIFKQRAAAKREEFVLAAEASISAGAAEKLSDAVETGIGEVLSRLPVAQAVSPIVELAIQLILIAALETMLAKVGI
jgi:hypothetical protein